MILNSFRLCWLSILVLLIFVPQSRADENEKVALIFGPGLDIWDKRDAEELTSALTNIFGQKSVEVIGDGESSVSPIAVNEMLKNLQGRRPLVFIYAHGQGYWKEKPKPPVRFFEVKLDRKFNKWEPIETLFSNVISPMDLFFMSCSSESCVMQRPSPLPPGSRAVVTSDYMSPTSGHDIKNFVKELSHLDPTLMQKDVLVDLLFLYLTKGITGSGGDSEAPLFMDADGRVYDTKLLLRDRISTPSKFTNEEHSRIEERLSKFLPKEKLAEIIYGIENGRISSRQNSWLSMAAIMAAKSEIDRSSFESASSPSSPCNKMTQLLRTIMLTK